MFVLWIDIISRTIGKWLLLCKELSRYGGLARSVRRKIQWNYDPGVERNFFEWSFIEIYKKVWSENYTDLMLGGSLRVKLACVWKRKFYIRSHYVLIAIPRLRTFYYLSKSSLCFSSHLYFNIINNVTIRHKHLVALWMRANFI